MRTTSSSSDGQRDADSVAAPPTARLLSDQPAALEGIRVIDVSKLWAGPSVTELLGNMGAEVIKIEAVQAMDRWRGGGTRLDVEREDGRPPWELSPNFNGINRNKYGITLDLTRPKGQELCKRLVAIGDIVVENFSPRVMAKFGLDYASLREIRPELVMISLPAFGMTGPWRDFVGFAYPTEQATGVPHFMGYEDGPPMLWGPAGADSFAGMTGAIGVLAALEQRRITGVGQYIDLSQVETITTWLGQAMIDYCWNGRLGTRHGNRHPGMAPHGCYPSSGDDRWLVVAVEDDDQWKALCGLLARSDWAARADLQTVDGRLAHQDELDAGLADWSRGLDHYAAADLLQAAGVAAAPVLEGRELIDDPQLNAREFIEWHSRAWVGLRAYNGMWAKFSRTPGTIRSTAPLFGEHNVEILQGLLGLSDEEISALEADRIIGTVPA